jgi:3-oxosteroid 1-dehydrogenase
MEIEARHGVILAAGGFEQNQEMRDRYLPVKTDARWSQSPKGANMGEATVAGEAIGAATESMDCCWWAPSMQLPSREVANTDVTHQMWLDHKHPHSLCVNRLGLRFVNEGGAYDRFGLAMIEDQKRTGANLPCWMIFDANYRKLYTAGGILPSTVVPDRKIPRDWWDQYLYRAGSIEELAGKIGIDPATLSATVARMNEFARTGVDLDFARGQSSYDKFFGDPRHGPNPCLGPVDKAPFYAIRVDLGDLGGKGGLKADASGRVLDVQDRPIEGLYAIGNNSGAPWGNAYPGGGSTLGPATVFGFIAASHIARRANVG